MMYGDLLKMGLPPDTVIIGFAENYALVVCWADIKLILEIRINDGLRRAKEWLENRGLRMAVGKTKAILVTKGENSINRSFKLQGED